VLFVPPSAHGADFVTGNALIAWNGTIESFHAVVAALPILRKAKSVHVCSIAEKDFTAKIAEQLIAYLTWQGIAARAVTPPKAKSVEAAIQAAIKTVAADLLVMGAYSHSRLREIVFGGVTRHFLEAAKIPVLMAH
jgi:nucleotide-binding universal stress UspA family protein